MVSIIKNQLLKHLSRFCKNLSADKINLSAFKGEGELNNLELDEIVLTDLLELPSWLRLTSAWCNKVTFRIQWTKLKSVPIFLRLDEVHIEVETCQDLRSPCSPQGAGNLAGSTKYSFIHKVIDGITVAVNLVSVTFKSPAFVASVQISRIMVESKTPLWQRGDLRMTRVKDPERGQLLIFKELEWQTVRIEAQSTKDKDLTPLRLLTNQARCRITIKKRISDCFVMGSRLVLILDDLLWVLTDSQLKAALHFMDSLGDLVERATVLERKTKAARKLEVLPEYQAQISQQQARTKVPPNTLISKMFTRYDVVETSYHFLSQRIDLHLCDDPGAGRSLHPDLKDGGALQVSLVKFQVDYYPYHLAIADRKHWAKYKENATPHSQWLQQSMSSFRGQFMDFIDMGRNQHSPLRHQKNSAGTQRSMSEDSERLSYQQTSNQNAADPKKPSQHSSGNPVKNYVLEQLAKLMTTCMIIKIDDFTIFKVTSSTRKPTTKEFIAGDRDKFCLPDDVTIVHAEFTYYYYPGDITFPLPPPKFYVQLNPIQVNYDICSCLWFNSFALNLYHSLIAGAEKSNAVSTSNLMYFDVKLEAILPRVVFEGQHDYPNQRDRPKSLHIQTSRVSITNVRSSERSSRADLAACLNAFQMAQMFFGAEFPSKESDFHVVTEKFLDHCAGRDNVRSYPENASCNSVNELIRQVNRELLWTEAKDVWCCNLEPVWGDFYGARAVGSARPVPFLDAFPLTIWLHVNTSKDEESTRTKKNGESSIAADIHGLAYISNLVSVQINHYQYLFLLRLSESIGEMATYLVVDSNKILKVETGGSVAIGALVPQIEVTFITPSQSPGKENSGGDLESVVPDSSSIADDLVTGNSAWQHTAANARGEYGAKRLNTSNDVETPQSEIASMLSMDFPHNNCPASTIVTFKNEDHHPLRFDHDPRLQTQSDHETTPKNSILKSPNFKSDNSSTPPPFIPNNFNVGLSSMKKGFANLMTSIDSALKASPEDGSSDTVSMRSDISSDSENYIVVSLEEQEKMDVFGSLNPIGITTVEEAREVLVEETPDTQSEKSMDSVCKRKDLVSMTTFKLSKMEIIQQSSGFASSLKVQISNIASEECSSIPWDEFQTKFSSRSRGWVELPSDADCRARIKLRLDHGLKNKEDSRRLSQASQCTISELDSRRSSQEKTETSNDCEIDLHNKQALMDMFEDTLEIRVADVPLVLSMSSVTGLADLAEDEIIPKPIPMEIFLENITLRLNEDRPPNNITSPGPIPIDLSISKTRISRDVTGIFFIGPAVNTMGEGSSNGTLSSGQSSRDVERDLEIMSLRQTSKCLKSENEELRRRIATLERLSEENSRLRRVEVESDSLKSRLTAAQEDINGLLKEKRVLQETITDLRDQMLRMNEPGNSNRASWSIKR